MIKIDWHPSPQKMRLWAVTMASGLAVMGALFSYVDWGVFAGGRNFGRLLWCIGGFAFLTGITGTRIGLPAYWAWMGFTFIVSSALAYPALAIAYFGVVTPLAVATRLAGRDRLLLRRREAGSWWHDLDVKRRHDPTKQF